MTLVLESAEHLGSLGTQLVHSGPVCTETEKNRHMRQKRNARHKMRTLNLGSPDNDDSAEVPLSDGGCRTLSMCSWDAPTPADTADGACERRRR